MGDRTKAKPHTEIALKNRFGANVREYRRRLRLSQEELAWRADMHRTYLADIERGGRNISLSSMVRLVNALGVPLSQFFATLEAGSPHPLEAPPRRQRAAGQGKARRADKGRSTAQPRRV